jgi:hypothetical protein
MYLTVLCTVFYRTVVYLQHAQLHFIHLSLYLTTVLYVQLYVIRMIT